MRVHRWDSNCLTSCFSVCFLIFYFFPKTMNSCFFWLIDLDHPINRLPVSESEKPAGKNWTGGNSPTISCTTGASSQCFLCGLLLS